jgi:hypothetical protein
MRSILYFHTALLTGMNGFWAEGVENTSDAVKYEELKVLAWCATSEVGVSTPLIGTVNSQAVDADIYITKLCPKLSNSSISTTKMTNQYFCPIGHRVIMH